LGVRDRPGAMIAVAVLCFSLAALTLPQLALS
jgi:hypothetical protein